MQRSTWGAEGSWDAGCLRAQIGFMMGAGALGEVRGLNYGFTVDARLFAAHQTTAASDP